MNLKVNMGHVNMRCCVYFYRILLSIGDANTKFLQVFVGNKKKGKIGNLLIKLYLAKFFDRLERSFIKRALTKAPVVRRMIRRRAPPLYPHIYL